MCRVHFARSRSLTLSRHFLWLRIALRYRLTLKLPSGYLSMLFEFYLVSMPSDISLSPYGILVPQTIAKYRSDL